MLGFDTRQIATGVWLITIIVGLTLWPRMRRATLSALRDAFATLESWKIIIPFTLYFAYAAALVFIARALNIWKSVLLVDTLMIIFFVGLPMFFNANNEKSGYELIKKTLRETVGVAALITFYIGLTPLSLAGELILQPIVAILVLFSVVASFNTKNKPVQKIANMALAGIGVWLMIRTIVIITETWHATDASLSFEKLTLSIALPLLLLPVVYIFALIMRYETVFLVAKNFNEDRHVPRFAYWAILMELNLQLSPLNNLGGVWLQKVVQAGNCSEARNVLRNLKRSFHNQQRNRKSRLKRLRVMKGRSGVDVNGLQFDRQEFYESKHDLKYLLYMQMGQFRGVCKHYNPTFPIEIAASELPKEHGITMKVRKDKKAWYAWRKMPNGYYFGVGGSQNVNDVWLYDALNRPSSFPSDNNENWNNEMAGHISTEWEYDDSPPELKIL